MSDECEWGQWIEWHGGECPCVGMYVHIVLGGGAIDDDCEWDDGTYNVINNAEAESIAKDGGGWWHDPSYYPIVRYRIRKPRALIDIIKRAREIENEKLGQLEVI